MKSSRIFAAAVALSMAGAWTAQARTWTLDDCISYAIEHNLTVQGRELELKTGQLEITEARNSFLPNVSASASQSFNFGRGLTSQNTYADRNTSSFQWGLSANVPLFQGLQDVRRLKYAKVNLRTLLYQHEAAKDDVTLNIISAYLQVLYSQEVLATAHAQVELSDYEVGRQEALAEAGKIPEVDLLAARSQLEQDRLSVINAQNDLTNSLLDLAQLMRLESIDDFEVVPLQSADPAIPAAAEVYDAAMSRNNSILAARNGLKAADAYISVARAGYIPRLSFNAGIGSSYYKLNGMDNPSFGSQMRHNYSTYFGFSLSIPLFDGFSTRNSVRRAKVQRLNASLQLDQASTELYRTIQRAYYNATGARDKYVTSLTTEEATRVAFEAMQEKYNIGRATPNEFEQSKTNLLKNTLSRISAHYEYLLRHRILLFYQGDINR